MLVGIKPTVGRISRYGIIPITADQDTAGPMARTVTDAAIMLGVLEGAAPDPNDPATKACAPPPGRDYTKFLRRDGLRGARIGIPRAFFYNETKLPGRDRPAGGLSKEQAAAMEEAIAVLKAEGAVIVDPADIPSVLDTDPMKNFATWGMCSGVDNAKGKDAALLGRAEVRHEARLQRVAGHAGRRRAGQDADRAADVQPHPHPWQRDQVRAVEPRHLRRDGRRGRPGPLRGRPREGHRARRPRTASTRS